MMSISKNMIAGLLISGLAVVSSSVRADVVVVVSAKNAAPNLTQDQVADIFLGRANTIPGAGRVVPVDQTEGSSVREFFYAKGVGKTSAQLTAYWSRQIFTGKGQPPKSVGDVAGLKTLLTANPDVISYMDKSLVDDSVKVLFTVK